MKNKNIILSVIFVLIVLVIGFIIVNKKATFEYFIDSFSFDKVTVKVGENSIDIYQNEKVEANNLSVRDENIKYIVIHYTGTNADADDIVNSYNRGTSDREASADFFIGFDGKIYQYNVDIENRYSWAVGGLKKEDSEGGTLHGVVTNNNSVSIELTTFNDGEKWNFEEKTIKSSKELVKYLMNKYDIAIDSVIRHYDVSGKLCPDVEGWIGEDDELWEGFLLELKEEL